MVERQCRPGTLAIYRWCFADFLHFAEGNPRTPIAISRFTTDRLRAYQYHLAERGLGGATVGFDSPCSPASPGGRCEAASSSPIRWSRWYGPRSGPPLPTTLRWGAVQELPDSCRTRRDRAIVALLAYGGLRRSEIVTLDIADFDPGFGLPKVHGKGGHDAAVPLPAAARAIVGDYLRADRPDAAASELFVVCYPSIASKVIMRRMSSRRVSTLVCDLGERSGIKGLHPHALRHACAVELLKRTRNLRAVQQHLRHRDIQTTTVYARLMPDELAQAVSAFDA